MRQGWRQDDSASPSLASKSFQPWGASLRGGGGMGRHHLVDKTLLGAGQEHCRGLPIHTWVVHAEPVHIRVDTGSVAPSCSDRCAALQANRCALSCSDRCAPSRGGNSLHLKAELPASATCILWPWGDGAIGCKVSTTIWGAQGMGECWRSYLEAGNGLQ